MRISKAQTYGDLRRMARRRLPRIIYDYIEGGLGDEEGIRGNPKAFSRFRIVPRYLRDVTQRQQAVTLFGQRFDGPFGIAPTGMAGMSRYGADRMLAEAARERNVPFVLSGLATAAVETIAAVAPEQVWYQLYGSRDPAVAQAIARRAANAGVRTLVLTVDIPAAPKRERDIRNGFVRPYRPSPSAFFEALLHPAWLYEYLRYGIPRFENWVEPTKPAASAQEVMAFLGTQHPASFTWDDLARYRETWKGRLVVKGILDADDARQAARLGVDGIIVSNHGGRQLDRAAHPLDVFPAIREAVGDDFKLMLDSGIRCGADIVTAYCLGAQYVFVGRATLYGAAAGGRAGAVRAIDILRHEVDLCMAQIGCTDLSTAAPSTLVKAA
jgi:L-lactate dehydrogenase (cytochrome)/(S)-mandelate dehydrogenase